MAELGIEVHTTKGYGDTAVAEHTVALLFSAARGVAAMARGVRAGGWTRAEGVQPLGETLGSIGYGGIGAGVARIARGVGVRVLAWNRTPREAEGVTFVGFDRLPAESHAVSLHLLPTDETRGFLSAGRIARMRPGAILINTARGALVDDAAMLDALEAGRLGHAALDVFGQEPPPPGHPLTRSERATLTAHCAFHTPEAWGTLLRQALDIVRRVAQT